MKISEIHEALFEFLLEENKKNKNFRFTTRMNNSRDRLANKYWFIGNDTYLEISFWDGKDSIAKINSIGFTVDLKKNKVYYNMSSKNKNGLEVIDEIVRTLDVPFIKEDYWEKILLPYITSADQIVACLKSFITNEKVKIDTIVQKYPKSGIKFISDDKFNTQLAKISEYR